MDTSSGQPQGCKSKEGQKIAADMSLAVKIGSDSSTGGESIGRMVKKASRSFSSRTSSLFRKSPERSSDEMDLSLCGTVHKGGVFRTAPDWLGQKEDQSSVLYEKITASSDGGNSSVRFSTSPGRISGQRSRSIGDAFKTCRKRLSMGSMKDGLGPIQDRDMELFAPLIPVRTPSEPPCIGDLNHVSNESLSSFRLDLDEALEDIVKRGKRSDYMADIRTSPFRPSLTVRARGRPSPSGRATNVLGDVANRKTRDFSRKKSATKDAEKSKALQAFDFGIRSDFAVRVLSHANIKTASNGQDDKTTKNLCQRNEVLESAKQSLAKSSPETARIMGQIQDMPPEARDKNVSVGGGIRARVKTAWPWIQHTRGTVRVFDSHAAALSSIQYEINTVHDLAFYDIDSQTYFLQPPCFPIDKEDDELGRSRGLELVSISFLNGTTQQNAAADILMPDEFRADGPRLVMTIDKEEDYVLVEIKDDRIPECPLARGDIDNLDEFISAEEY